MGPLGEAMQRRERGLGGPEMEQPGFWEGQASQPMDPLREIEANFKDGSLGNFWSSQTSY